MPKQIDRERLINHLINYSIHGNSAGILRDDLIMALETGYFDVPKAAGWIDIKKQEPEAGELVLFLSKAGNRFTDTLENILNEEEHFEIAGKPESISISMDKVTHWMPLPQPPAPEKDDETV